MRQRAKSSLDGFHVVVWELGRLIILKTYRQDTGVLTNNSGNTFLSSGRGAAGADASSFSSSSVMTNWPWRKSSSSCFSTSGFRRLFLMRIFRFSWFGLGRGTPESNWKTNIYIYIRWKNNTNYCCDSLIGFADLVSKVKDNMRGKVVTDVPVPRTA